MSVVVVTGSAGLVRAESVRFFADRGLGMIGIDNDMRQNYFGPVASTVWARRLLKKEISRYGHIDADIRNVQDLERVFRSHGRDTLGASEIHGRLSDRLGSGGAL